MRILHTHTHTQKQKNKQKLPVHKNWIKNKNVQILLIKSILASFSQVHLRHHKIWMKSVDKL